MDKYSNRFAYAGLAPEELFIIDNLETLKVIADPLRLQMLARLRDQPQSAKQLAAGLTVALKRLYYHLNLLEEHQLIRVVDTRIVSGIIEKIYHVTAYRLSVERDLLASGDDHEQGLDVFLSLILDHARAEIRRSVRAGLINLDALVSEQSSGLVLGRRWLQLTAAQAEAFMQGLKALEDSFEKQDAPDTDAQVQRYELLIGLYPVLPPEQPASTESHSV